MTYAELRQQIVATLAPGANHESVLQLIAHASSAGCVQATSTG